jgi:hypothetical protein
VTTATNAYPAQRTASIHRSGTLTGRVLAEGFNPLHCTPLLLAMAIIGVSAGRRCSSTISATTAAGAGQSRGSC